MITNSTLSIAEKEKEEEEEEEDEELIAVLNSVLCQLSKVIYQYDRFHTLTDTVNRSYRNILIAIVIKFF